MKANELYIELLSALDRINLLKSEMNFLIKELAATKKQNDVLLDEHIKLFGEYQKLRAAHVKAFDHMRFGELDHQ